MVKIDYNLTPPADFTPIPDSILEQSIVARFEESAEKFPAHSALESEEHRLTYRQLNNAVNELARKINEKMGSEPSPVAFLFRDEVYSIVAFIAALKTGRVFVGLHPSQPVEQLKAFWEDSTARLLITSAEFKPLVETMLHGPARPGVLYVERLNAESETPNPPRVRARPRDPYSIFYTSGSSGKPKGVLSAQDYMSQMILYMTNEWFFSPSDRISLFTSVCFLAAYPSVLGALLNGGTLCMFDLKRHSARAALEWIRDAQLTVFRSTPSIFRTIFGQTPAGLVFPRLRFLTLGGEPVTGGDVDLFKAHTAADCMLINNLAATEANLICHNPVSHRTPSFVGFLPAGYPAPGKEVLVVDEEGKEVEAGQEGEIVVRSRYLSLGYWRQPELTAQKFRPDPDHPGFGFYFTADRGRIQENGMLSVLGRQDTQVKIRGYRVQLEAIDQALRSFPGVLDAATIVHRSSRGGGERLATYVCLGGAEQLSVSRMRRHLAARLASYMIPSVFVQVESLPRTPTGKLARLQLPEPSSARPDLETPFVAPRNETERRIAAIWEQALDVTGVGVNDNFFELGGDSLTALEMTLEVEKALGMNVPQAAFAHPTIASLAQVSGAEAGTSTPEAEEKFILASFRKAEQEEARAARIRQRPLGSLLGKLASRAYSSRDVERAFDALVSRYVVGKPFLEARRWTMNWSRNARVRNLFYRGRYNLFSKFVANLRDCQARPEEIFPLNLAFNIGYGQIRFLGEEWRSIRNDIEAVKRSPLPYWHSIAHLISSGSAQQVEEGFPIRGLEHLTAARRAGRGVILLAFHGSHALAQFMVLGKLLGVGEIPTISHRIPARQSEFGDETDNLSYEVASALNAEIAMYAQKRLQAGEVVNVVGDTSDSHGRRFEISVGGRLYHVKAGFAELALNTGAAILPHYGSILPDGRSQINIEPPLEPGAGDRASQVEGLIAAYADFITRAWAEHPEIVSWARIRRHLAQPPA